MARVEDELEKALRTQRDAFTVILEKINGRIGGIADGVLLLNQRVDGLDQKFDRLEARVDKMDLRLMRMEGEMTGVKGELVGVKDRLTSVEDHVGMNGTPKRPRKRK